MGVGLHCNLYVFLYVYKIKAAASYWLAAALLDCLAERTRFELVVGLLLRQFSKLVVTATHPPLLDALKLRLALICSANLGVIF